MTKPAQRAYKPELSSPPHWLSRAEKLLFRRIVSERKAAGLPVSAIVEATVCDFAMARSRLRELRKMLAEAQAEISELESERSYVLQLFRELDRVSRLCSAFGGRLGSP